MTYSFFDLIFEPLEILSPPFGRPVTEKQMDRECRSETFFGCTELLVLFISMNARDAFDALLDIETRPRDDPERVASDYIELMMESSLPDRPLL